MKISLNWLSDYIETGLSIEELCHKLTMAGLEVEKVENVSGDIVIEMEITPNRPDCLNVLGIAREISAILNKQVKKPVISEKNEIKKKCDILIDDNCGCSRYIGTIIENVTCATVEKKIKNRIEALGMRAINNIVDITNFCLMEMGQPLHAFDFDKLKGSKIVVRRAKKGEKIVTIDGVERELDPSILVIADEKRPVAIAGIMGGKETEVTGSTKNILLESAYFNPILIRRSARKLGLSSDSSYRFERGVDFNIVEECSRRAADLIIQSARGNIVAQSDIIAEKNVRKNKAIKVSLSDINDFLGSKITISRCKSILSKLDFEVSEKDGVLSVKAPDFRSDIVQKVDIFEEIGRIVGYDNLPETMPLIKSANVSVNKNIEKRKTLKTSIIAQGYNEVVTYSMFSLKHLEKSGLKNLTAVKIRNPLTQEQEIMRPSLFPSLLSVVLSNINKGQKNLRLFEAGKIYLPSGERETLGVIVTGIVSDDWRVAIKKDLDFYDIKGMIENAVGALHVSGLTFSVCDDAFLEEGQRAKICIGSKQIGVLGKVEQDILLNWGIKQKNVLFAQIDIEALFAGKTETRKHRPATEYPSIVRDVSLAVKQDVVFDKIKHVVVSEGGQILSAVDFKEEYLGDKISIGNKGIVFSLTYQAQDRTLKEEEVNLIHEKVLSAVINKFDAVQR